MHNALWSILQQFLRQGLVAVFIFVLARKASPTEFGLIGIANIWNTFLYLFLELGFAAGWVQRKEISQAHIQSAFVINVAAGVAMMLLSMGLSGPASLMLKAPEAQPVIAAISISFLFTALASIPLARAQRELKFKEIAVRDFAANTIACGVGIALALMGRGVWAVVANSVLINLLLAVFLWRLMPGSMGWRGASLEAMRDLWGFGAKVFGYTGLKYFLKNVDSMVVGALFGPERLGLYNFAQRVTNAPTKSLQYGLATFLFPRASQSQNDPRALRDLYLLSFKSLNYMVLLFSVLLATVGMDLLIFVAGRQWEEARPVIRVLLLAQVAAPVIVPVAELLKATNRANWLLGWSILQALITIVALWIGSRVGFEAAVVGMVASWWVTIPLLAWMTRSLTGLRFQEFCRSAWRSYCILFAAGLALWGGWERRRRGYPVASAGMYACAVLASGMAYVVDPDVKRLWGLVTAKVFKGKSVDREKE